MSKRKTPVPPARLEGLVAVEELPPGEVLPAVLQVATGLDPDCRPYRAYLSSADRTLFVVTQGRPIRRVPLAELLTAVVTAEPIPEEPS